jgi:tetratricopeptide (TPR) repeat protein
VQHAHQKGIIHRDLKPSNVLVSRHDTTAMVKVIDFGVAKALAQQLTDKTCFTGVAQMIGTPLYMSPEQAGMSDLDIDTRSDIYALGVLLYELLTGATPFDRERFKQAPYDEICRIIRDEEPPRPSTRLAQSTETLASISAQRHMEPAKLTRLVRGELDWIVMKALEKDRNHRYESASAFAADVQRYLHDEPVLACPPSAAYRVRKFIRRQKRSLAAAAVLGAALLAAVAGVGWAIRDRGARQAAVEQEANLALKDAARWEEQKKWAEALSAAKRAEGLLAGGGSDDLLERIRELRRDVEMVLSLETAQLQGLDGPGFSSDLMDAAYLKAFRDYGIDVEALPADRAAELIHDRPIRLELSGALDLWAMCRPSRMPLLLSIVRAADPDEWRNRVRDALPRLDRHEPGALTGLASPDQVQTLPPQDLCFIGCVLARGGRLDDAIALLRDAQQRHPDDFWINWSLAGMLERKPSARDDLVRYYSAALALRPSSGVCMHCLGKALLNSGRPDEAMPYFRKVLELEPSLQAAHMGLGDALAKVGRLDESIAEYRKVLDLQPRSPQAERKLGFALWRNGRPEEAVAFWKKAFEDCLYYGATPAGANAILGKELAQVGRWSEAADAFERALELDPKIHDYWCNAAALRAAAGDLEGYRRTCRGMVKRFGNTPQPQTAERTARACLLLPDSLDAADSDRVQKLADRAVTGTEKAPFYRFFVLAKGLADYRVGRNDDAVKRLPQFGPKPAGVHWDATGFAVLAMAQHGLGRDDEARASLARAKAILVAMPDPARGQLFGVGWLDWLHARVLCHEAEELLKKESATRNQPSKDRH